MEEENGRPAAVSICLRSIDPPGSQGGCTAVDPIGSGEQARTVSERMGLRSEIKAVTVVCAGCFQKGRSCKAPWIPRGIGAPSSASTGTHPSHTHTHTIEIGIGLCMPH